MAPKEGQGSEQGHHLVYSELQRNLELRALGERLHSLTLAAIEATPPVCVGQREALQGIADGVRELFAGGEADQDVDLTAGKEAITVLGQEDPDEIGSK